MTGHDYKLAYGMTFITDPGPHMFERVPLSDDLCRVCGYGWLDKMHQPAALPSARPSSGDT